MKHLLIALCLVIGTAAVSWAAPDVAARHLRADTFGVIAIDTTRVDLPAAWNAIAAALGMDAAHPAAAVTGQLNGLLDQFRAAGGRELLIPIDPDHLPPLALVAPIGPEVDPGALAEVLPQIQPAGTSRNSFLYLDTVTRLPDVVLCSGADFARQWQHSAPAPRGELADALANVADYPVRAAVALSSTRRRAWAEMSPLLFNLAEVETLPAPRWVALGLRPDGAFALEAVVQFETPAAAEQWAALLIQARDRAADDDRLAVFELLPAAIRRLQPEAHGNQLRLDLDHPQCLTLLRAFRPVTAAD